MEQADAVRPVIIKRKKVMRAAEHHGGAWKVAYADFVTAMMAFFLMLWLLGSVTEDKRKGLADYFSDTRSVQSDSAGGEGVFGGVSLSPETSLSDDIATRERHQAEASTLQQIADALTAMAAQDSQFASAFEHVTMGLTEEGLVLELFDLEGSSLFDGMTDTPRPILLYLLDVIAEAFATVANPIAISAHTRAFPSVFLENPVWPLSLARATAAHQTLAAGQLDPARITRVTGKADRDPAVETLTAARNNRIELVLLRQHPLP